MRRHDGATSFRQHDVMLSEHDVQTHFETSSRFAHDDNMMIHRSVNIGTACSNIEEGGYFLPS